MKTSLEVPAFWRTVAWIGNLGWGLTVFTCAISLAEFKYRSFKGIIATPAFLLYPEQRDFWVYLMALAIIPTVTVAGYAGWLILVSLNQKMQGSSRDPDISLTTASFLLGWAAPLGYFYTSQIDLRQIGVSATLFVLLNVTVLIHRWLLAHPSPFPPLPLHGKALLIGLIFGVALLTSPFTPIPLIIHPLYGLLGSGLIFWVCWLASSYFLNRLLHIHWSTAAESILIGVLPLSVLPSHALLWWKVRQDGRDVAEYGSPTVIYLFWSAVAIASLILTYKSLRSLTRSGKWLSSTVSQRWFFYLAIPLLLYVLAYNPNIHRPLDLFHEGERLSPAYAIANGKVPYKDVVFIHGFLRDPGIALITFRLLGSSVAALRVSEQLLYPLVIVLMYYLAFLCIGESAILVSLLSLTGFWPFFYDWRMIPCLLTLIMLVLLVRRRSPILAVIASFFSFLALITSLDVGILCIITTLTLALGLAVVTKQRAILIASFLTLALCLVPAFIYLSSHHALFPALRWTWHVLAVSRDWNGMPFPSFADFSSNWALAIKAFLSPVASVVAGTFVLFALARRNWGERHWLVLMLLSANVLLYNRALVGGQLHSSHLQDGSHFAPLLLLTLLAGNPKERKQIWVIVHILLALALLTPSRLSSGRTLFDIVDRLPFKNRVEIPSDWVLSKMERVGSLFLPPEQASRLYQIVDFLSKADSFWDFTDHGALYFLSEHLSPSRFYATHHVITLEDQMELIAALEMVRPSYVLFRSGTGWDAIAGIDRTVRSFLVSKYLLRNYHYYGQIGGFVVLERGAPTTFPQPLSFQVNMGYVPALLEQFHFGYNGQAVGILNGDWHIGGDGNFVTRSAQEWHIQTTGPDVWVQNLALNVDPRSVSYLRVRMRIKSTLNDLKAQVFWCSSDEGFSEERSVIFNVIPDNQEYVYLIPLASFPSWTWSGTITGLRFYPADGPAEVRVTAVELLYTGDDSDLDFGQTGTARDRYPYMGSD